MRATGSSLGTAEREQRQAAPTCGCLHTSRRSARHTRATLRQRSRNLLAPVSAQGPECVAAAGWEAPHIFECVYTGQCFRLLQALSATLGWCGPLVLPRTSSLRQSLLEEQSQTICRALLFHCIGQAMPPAALQENSPWQAALAVPSQTPLPELLELGSSKLDMSTSLKHPPAGALPWERAGELGKHLPSDGGGCRGCLFLGKKH